MADIENESPPKNKSTRSKRSKKSADEAAIENVEFQAETSNLDIIDDSKDDTNPRVSKLAELARKVAQTIADRDGNADGDAMNAHDLEAKGEEAAKEATEQVMAPSDYAHEIASEEGLAQEAAALEELVEADEEVMHDMTAQAEVEGVTAEMKAEASAASTDMEMNPDLNLDAPIAEAEAVTPEMEQMGFMALEQELDAAENDADPEPTEFIEQDQLISIMESLLFSTDKPVSTATIKALFKGTNVRTKDIVRGLDILASEYASASRGVTLEEINGGYQLRTKVDNAEFLKRLAKTRPFRLSGPALEVMSIVAYKQPVTKHEVDEIRGVESGHLLRALMERGMVNFQGKAEHLPGKPMAYGTTRKFLETFGLRNIRELPTLSEIDDLLPEGIGEVEEEKQTLSDLTGELSTAIGGTYSEGEDELLKINDQLKAIDTTSEFFEQEKVRERERRDRDRAQDIREKIVLGDDVDEKDRRWLDRYEAKLANPSLADEPGEGSMEEAVASSGAMLAANEGLAEGAEFVAEAAPAEISDEEVSAAFGEKLEGLTREADESREISADDEESSDDDGDDLVGDLDWNEDSESSDDQDGTDRT